VGYGFWQFIDVTWFPSGVGKGIDPFIWRGAFGVRVFSTYGNPNFFADFLVIIFPILLTQYLKTRRKSLVPLMAMLLVDLYKSGTKGAWIGFAMVIFLFGMITFAYFKEQVAPWRRTILAMVVGGVLGIGAIVAKDLQARIVSVNFRLFTWESTWEMIMTHPWIGTGVGSFPPIYPAFRRPAIFHIEGKHNTETDHAENEYLEQLFDNGILGFGVFLWLMLSTFVVGFRSLRQMLSTQMSKDGRAPPRAYDLIGYLVALMGMLGHNLFDVSLRFVSSGIYIGLLSGMVLNLARGQGLYELHGLRASAIKPVDEPSLWRTFSEFLIWPMRLLAWGGLAYADFLILKEFNELQGPLSQIINWGEFLSWWLAWLVLASCVVGLTGIFMRLVLLSQKPLVAAIIFAALHPLYLFWGYFKADVHHNFAIVLSRGRNWDKALEHYFIVHKLNPNFVMSLYFTGNVYSDRFDMNKAYRPAWGDKDRIPRDDYERALEAYDHVQHLSPNYVQMHHQVGALHMKRAEWAINGGHPEQAPAYLAKALSHFKLYEQVDPVFPLNYYRMGQVYMLQKHYPEATKAFEALIHAEKCAVAPALLSKSFLKKTILSYQAYVQEGASPVHRHESGEAYFNLGNAYLMMGSFTAADKAYRESLALEPGHEQARRNLSVLYQRAQAMGLLRRVSAPASPPESGALPYTGYEIVLPTSR
jgi:tetratricopeptide (TPR) repeat protein